MGMLFDCFTISPSVFLEPASSGDRRNCTLKRSLLGFIWRHEKRSTTCTEKPFCRQRQPAATFRISAVFYSQVHPAVLQCHTGTVRWFSMLLLVWNFSITGVSSSGSGHRWCREISTRPVFYHVCFLIRTFVLWANEYLLPVGFLL